MSRASILVFMSEGEEQQRLVGLLKEAGYEARGVGTAEAASEQLIAEPWDVLLCELDPADDERLSLLSVAQQRLPYLARLLLARESQRAQAQKALESGVVHFALVPPVDRAVLRDTVEALLAWARDSRLSTPTPQTARHAVVRRLRQSEEIRRLEREIADSQPIRRRIEWYY